jgi:hypothetical protein
MVLGITFTILCLTPPHRLMRLSTTSTVVEATRVAVVSLRHDSSTTTGEEVVLFTRAEQPLFRELKRK